MSARKNNPAGQPFNEILEELHAHAFNSAPSESDPFVLTKLELEYIAYTLALYYNCEHCKVFHGKQIERLGTNGGPLSWNWRREIIKIVLYLRTERRFVSDCEWEGWLESWRNFANVIARHHPSLACYIAYAVGIARADRALMDLAFASISSTISDSDTLIGVVRDIDRVVVFMKAAISKNRTDPIIREQFATRGASF